MHYCIKHTRNILLTFMWRKGQSKNILIEIHSPPQGAHSGTCSPPVMVAPVIPRPQQVLPPPVVGHLVEDPPALQHIEGVDLTEVEALMERGAVLRDLHHLASVVLSLVDPQPVGTGLWVQQSADGKSQKTQSLATNHSHPWGKWALKIFFYIKDDKKTANTRVNCIQLGRMHSVKLKRVPFTQIKIHRTSLVSSG